MPSRSSLVAVWLAAAVGLGGLMLVAGGAPAPPLPGGLPAPGRRAVVFLARPAGLERLCHALAESGLRTRADVVVVVHGVRHSCDTVPVVVDPAGRVGAGYGLRRPRDGGPPVGYAVVDSRGRIRYRTLDAHPAMGLDEVGTIVGDTP